MKQKKLYWYEMVKRPVDLGCQPTGFVAVDHKKGRWGIVAYERKLTQKELDDFDMRVWETSN